MASNENSYQPLINSSTSGRPSRLKYIETLPSTLINLTSNLSSPIPSVKTLKNKITAINEKSVRQKPNKKRSPITHLFMINMERRMALRNELRRHLSRLCDITWFVGLFGIVLMIIQNEIVFAAISQKDLILSWSIKLIITISTIILIGLIFLYYYLYLNLDAVHNFIDDWRVPLTNSRICLLLLEVIVCAIHPIPRSFPTHPDTIINKFHSNSTTVSPHFTSYTSIDVFLSLPMFLRFYLLTRCIVYHSHLIHNSLPKTISYFNIIPINIFFVVKTHFEKWPLRCLLLSCTLTFFIGSWCLRACDFAPGVKHLQIGDAMWLFIVTFTTVGYGDLMPITYCGRIIATIISLIGVFSSALLITAVAQSLMLSHQEKNVHNLILNGDLVYERTQKAANKRNKKPLSSIQYLQLRKQLFQSIHQFKENKQNQRNLLDDNVSLFEIVTTQRRTDSTADKTMEKILKLEVKMNNMEEQLINVNHAIQSMQNTLNLLVDKITK